jgi:hypothetical protein
MKLDEAKQTLKEAGYILEKKEYVEDKIIQALTMTNSGWTYLKDESIPHAGKSRLEFANEDGRYLMLQAQSVDQHNWVAFLDYDMNDDDSNGWDEVKENLSYYDILDLFT